MEEDDDDFYGGGGADDGTQDTREDAPIKDEQMNDAHVQDEDDEDDDEDEDDVEFTLEKPADAKSEPARPATRSQDATAPTDSKTSTKGETPVKQETPARPGSTAPPTAVKGVLTYDGKEGKDFPEIRTSKVDVDGNPMWPGNNKPIIEMDIDADLAEHSKPWRITGTDQTDYFNYGFDEYTWTMYCMKQRTVRSQIEQQKDEEDKMKAALGITGGGPPSMDMMGGMGGMPDMQTMQQMMMASGMDPNHFQQFMNGTGGGFPPPPNMGGMGSGQNSASPAPGGGQGFQAPAGPGNMEGYSPQQMAIMQSQGLDGGGGGGGGGRGRGRGRRGRGYY